MVSFVFILTAAQTTTFPSFLPSFLPFFLSPSLPPFFSSLLLFLSFSLSFPSFLSFQFGVSYFRDPRDEKDFDFWEWSDIAGGKFQCQKSLQCILYP